MSVSMRRGRQPGVSRTGLGIKGFLRHSSARRGPRFLQSEEETHGADVIVAFVRLCGAGGLLYTSRVSPG